MVWLNIDKLELFDSNGQLLHVLTLVNMRNIQVLVIFWSLGSDKRPEVKEGEKLKKSDRFKEVSKDWKVSHDILDGWKKFEMVEKVEKVKGPKVLKERTVAQ